MKICVIGTGPSGLCAGQHLKEAGIDFVIFESQSNIGGIWNYNPKTEKETGYFVQSGVYDSLHTNIPIETMQYADFPFGSDPSHPSYVHHSEVTNYYHQYVDHFDIRRNICLNHNVESIRPTSDKVKPKWEVKVRNMPADILLTTTFDSVIICVGHDSHPYYPPIPGLDKFSGTVIHAHDYRRPDMFKDKVVYVIGANFSGIDISLDISKVAKQIFVGNRQSPYRQEMMIKAPKPLEEVREPEKIEDGKVYLADGKLVEPDIILVATGYQYEMPFLTEECELTINDRRVYPLYKHFVHPKWQNMYFIGVPRTVSQNPMARHQAKLITRLIEGKATLPSEEDMIKDTDAEYREMIEVKNYPHHWAHEKGLEQFKLHKLYAKMGGFEPDPPVVGKLYWHFFKAIVAAADRYRVGNYEIVDEEHFKILAELPELGFEVGQIV